MEVLIDIFVKINGVNDIENLPSKHKNKIISFLNTNISEYLDYYEPENCNTEYEHLLYNAPYTINIEDIVQLNSVDKQEEFVISLMIKCNTNEKDGLMQTIQSDISDGWFANGFDVNVGNTSYHLDYSTYIL